MNPPSSSTSPARAAAILLAAGAIAMTIAVALLELVFGSWLSSNPWDRALALNLVVDRRMTFDATGLYPGGGSVAYTRDRWGLRGSYGEPREVDILTVGGSTTDQRFIADGSTWQDALERVLRASGKDVRVANAGVDGHSTFAHLAAFDDWFPLVPGLRPRYTILYVGLNDLFLGSPRKLLDGEADGRPTLKSRIKANSALFRLYAMARGALLARKLGVDHQPTDFRAVRWTHEPRLADHEAVGRARAEAFGERLGRLLARVKTGGSTPVCVTQPSLFYRVAADGTVTGTADEVKIPFVEHEAINGVDFHHLRKAQDSVMKARCAAAGAVVVDMEAAAWQESDFYDFVHMTPAGAGKLGERIAAAMAGLAFP
jgi:lysophospholipase L1-like esterase